MYYIQPFFFLDDLMKTLSRLSLSVPNSRLAYFYFIFIFSLKIDGSSPFSEIDKDHEKAVFLRAKGKNGRKAIVQVFSMYKCH